VVEQLLSFTQTQTQTQAQTQAITVTGQVGYGYNANGDLTHDGLRTFSYDAEGRPSNVSLGASTTFPTTRYAHNALGQRVFKTEPLYPPSQPNEADPAFVKILIAFFTELWGSSSADADKLGWAFTYDEDGNLIAETGTGGADSTGSTQHIYLPTANGAMPIAAVINGAKFAVHADHLNTPRRLTNDQGQPVWQWAYSAFGDNQPTTARYRFADPVLNPNPGTTGYAELVYNKRYDGQYFDKETWLNYNYFRGYSPTTGRYTQSDPIGLDGGWNRFGYVNANPLKYSDPRGLCPMCLIPALPYVGEAAVVAAAWWASQNTFQDKTPNRGNPGDWHTNPGSGQERLYGLDGRPAVDIDWDHDHGQGQPHPHNWSPNGREVPEGGFSPWPRGRTNPAQCNQ
jgi:RHS repeat-associated protein